MTNEQQKKYLVEFVCKNYVNLYGRMNGPNGREKQNAKWAELTSVINELGPKKEEKYWRNVSKFSLVFKHFIVKPRE